jgi:hypothetical protein
MKGVRTDIETTLCRALCLDCDKTWNAPNALAVAARHTAAFGHHTAGEAATVHSYRPAMPR